MISGNGAGPGAAKAFGRLLKFYRVRAKMSQEALGDLTSYSKSQVAMIERGERKPSEKFVEIADPALGAQGALLEVAEELKLSGVAAWFEDYLGEEKRAAAIHKYENRVIPGLLQTPVYAKAVFNCALPVLDDEEIEANITARMARKEIFHRKRRPHVTFVLEKLVINRPIGGRAVLRENLLHILDIARLSNVCIQIIPDDRETHAGIDGPFTLLETAKRRSQLVYVEGQNGRYFLTEQPDVGEVFARYGTLRAQALTPEDSVRLIEQVAQSL
ncbi:helix-turn-helix domain-containing protein [Streptomyces coeruleoprunus]|uniref:Helix-turn-helix domain-containing protein n=1 Tax=Streptomyces coeruleoprunus TaxID=285563 RepID=A0ABV9XL05_9ACTN